MPATHRNPNVANTAARYVCKAQTAVHPAQRAELLQAMIRHARAGLSQIETGTVPAELTPERPSFLDQVRDILGDDADVRAA